MYPFSIKSEISRNQLASERLHKLFIHGVNGRTIKRIARDHYILEEPYVFNLNRSFVLVHEIHFTKDKIIFTTSSSFAGLIGLGLTVVLSIMLLGAGLESDTWHLQYILLLLITWFVVPAFFYIGYLLVIPSFKELKRRITEL